MSQSGSGGAPASPNALNGPDTSDAPSNIRAVMRAGTEFFLRCIDNTTVGQHEDMIAALIFTAVWTGNIRHITTQTTANLAHGGVNDIPPDSARRPISVLAVANSLRMPYETVRRRARALIAAGECVQIEGRGLIVPAAVLSQPKYHAAIRDAYPILLRHLAELKFCQYDFAPYRRPLPQTVPMPPAGTLPANARALLRVSTEAMMRGVDALGRVHNDDFLRGIVFSAVWTANVRHIVTDEATMTYGAIQALPPDEMRRPVAVSAVSDALRLPYQTTRGYVAKLIADGMLVRDANRKLIAPSAAMATPTQYNALRQAHAHIGRLIADLHRAGFDFREY